jgi:hypothetical protein
MTRVAMLVVRFGAVFAIAIASAVFSVNGHLGSPASVTAGFRPALWACACFAVLAAVSATAITSSRRETSTQAEPRTCRWPPEGDHSTNHDRTKMS